MPKRRKSNRHSSESSSSSSSTSSTSSSSSSSSSSPSRRKHLNKKVKRLEKQIKSKSNRYQGKIDSVPAFRASLDGLTMEQWLHAIESTGDVFDWDDKARIFCMSNKLRGNAKHWYNNQETFNLSWRQWKQKLLQAFPSQAGVFSKLKELVNTERDKNQNLVDFYYRKLSLGQSCKLADATVADIIVNTINDPFVKSGARAARCSSTAALLKFLISSAEQPREFHYNEKSRDTVKRQGNMASRQKMKCYICGAEGHKKIECPKFSTSKICNFCKFRGHLEEECYKKKKNTEVLRRRLID